MRILLIAQTLDPVGGAEVITASLCSGLRELGHDVAFLSDGERPGLYRIGGKLEGISPKILLRAKRWAPDLVLCTRPRLLFRSSLISTALQLPLVFHAHDAPPSWGSLKHFRYAVHRCRKVVTVSDDLLGAWREHAPRECVVRIYNGVEVAATPPPAPNNKRPSVLFSGRFVPEKGLILLLQAWESSQALRDEADLAIAGVPRPDGHVMTAWESEVEARLARLGIAAQPWIANFREEVRNHDLYVMPSTYREGLPMASLEALGQGVPVIATRMGGLAEEFANGLSDLLVEPTVSSLRHGLESSFRWRSTNPGLGGRCHIHARDNFSLSQMVKQWAALLNRVVLSPRGRGQ